ncbi:MAG: hypothetical protein HUJ66_08230 [Oscillospiraceae bacterium]|nr:hypothetical protein [Oscillospiraceae bacterium]
MKYVREHHDSKTPSKKEMEERTKAAINGKVQMSDRATKYDYNTLIKKPNMKITVIDDSKSYQVNSETRKSIVNQAIINAKQIGTNENGNAVIHIADTDSDVILSKHGLQHGLDRRLNILAPITINAGLILKNSVRINELTPKEANASGSYVTIGMARSESGTPYIVRFVINQYTNELSSVDVLYAANAKKEPAALNEPAITDKPLRITDSEISIEDLLKYVNKYFPDILPESVLKEFGYDARPDGKLGESALFSLRDSAGDQLSKGQQEYFRDSKVRDADGNLMLVYHGTPGGGFTVFDKSKIGNSSDYGYPGRGFYFTPKERVAKYYTGHLKTGEVKAGYLNITNPCYLLYLFIKPINTKKKHHFCGAFVLELLGRFELPTSSLPINTECNLFWFILL